MSTLAEWNRKRKESAERMLAFCNAALSSWQVVGNWYWPVHQRQHYRWVVYWSKMIKAIYAASLKERLG